MRARALILAFGGLIGCASSFAELARDVSTDLSGRIHQPIDFVRSADEQADAVRAWLREPLTADRAVAVAMAQNHALRASLEEIGIARAELTKAALPPNPIAGGHARFPVGTPDGVRLLNSADYSGDLSIDLTRLLLTGARKGAAEARVEQAKLEAAATASRLVADVRAAFFSFQGESQLLGCTSSSPARPRPPPTWGSGSSRRAI